MMIHTCNQVGSGHSASHPVYFIWTMPSGLADGLVQDPHSEFASANARGTE